MAITGIPNWVIYPEEDWVSITPEDAGLDEDRFHKFIGALDLRGAAFGGEDHSDLNWGTVITRGGYLLHEWGNRSYRFQTDIFWPHSQGRVSLEHYRSVTVSLINNN